MGINWKRNAALFLTGQALSFFGTMVVQYAILWHITLKSQSGTMMTLFTVAGFLPMFFISPFAGVWADRFNRKYIINIADGVTAFFSLVMAILLLLGIDSYVILLVCAAIRAAGQGAQTPAVGAFIPQIVPEEYLTKINGFQSSIRSFVTLATPMLSGALMTFAPLEILFFLDVITAIIGISIVFFLVKIPSAESKKIEITKQKSAAYFSDLKEGIKYAGKNGFVLRMLIISAIFPLVFVPASLLTPLQVTRNFGAEVWRLSAIEITFSAGMLAGGLLIGMWGGFKNRIYTMTLSGILCGLLFAGLGLCGNFPVYLIIMALVGVAMPLYDTPAMVLLQTTVEPAFLGRVFSVFTMISSVMMPLGMVVFGPLADIISIDLLLIVTGLAAALLAIIMSTSKTLRKAGASVSVTSQENGV
ncbi:MAG TPA: MFS transporter [Treponema sp.]|nr:MFS transporter [Treponema sp.]